MVRSNIMLLALLASASALGGDFSFSAKGYFSDEANGIQFGPSWDSNHTLKNLPSGTAVNFTGPLFAPGKEQAVESLPVEIDVQEQSCSAPTVQRCGAVKADVRKTFKLVNGGVLATIGWKPASQSAQYWIYFPQKLFAGKDACRDGGKFVFPVEKAKSYTLCQGKGPAEFRFALSPDLELGLKLISGVTAYSLNDCRHGLQPHPDFYMAITAAGDNFSYFLCLLKPGQAFPPLAPTPPQIVKRNLLGPGSDFEIGQHGFTATPGGGWLATQESPPLLFDTNSPHQGRFSLKLTIPDTDRREFSQAWFSPVRLDPTKTYTLSAWMKSDVPFGLKAGIYCPEPEGDQGGGAEWTVGTAWKRYHFKFKPDTFKLLNYRCPTIYLPANVKSGSLWVDEVQLEEGDQPSAYRAEPFEFGASVEQPYKLFTPEELEGAAFTLRFRDNAATPDSRRVDYAVTDYWDKEVAKGSVTAEVPGGSGAELAVKIPKLPCGYYRARFDSPDGVWHDEAIFGVYQALDTSTFLPLDWPIAFQSDDKILNLMPRKLGFGSWRCWWDKSFSLKGVEPDSGRFDFSNTDSFVERCLAVKLNPLPILGCEMTEHDIPAWALERSEASAKGSWIKEKLFPRLDAWKGYVGALVSRYRGKVKVWEVMNEPNCWYGAADYRPYLQAAYEAAHAADPACLVIGGSTTSDMGNQPAPWTSELFALDSCRSLDILSVHMYGRDMPERNLNGGVDKFLGLLKAKMREHGKNLPIWHTEKTLATTNRGYSYAKHRIPKCYPAVCTNFTEVPDFRAKAEYLLRDTLLCSAVGGGPFFWFEGLLDRALTIRLFQDEFGHIEFDGSPCPEILAANGLARMLEGRNTPKELVKFGADKYCTLHEGPKGTLAALWDCSGKSSLKLPADIGMFTLHDFFGVEKPHGASLELGTAPIYLLFDDKDAATVKALLLKSEGDGPKLSLSGGLELEGDSPVLVVYAFNKTWRDLKEKFTFNAETARADCAPETYARVTFPVPGLKADTAPLEFAVAGGDETAKLGVPPFKSEAWLKAVLSDATETVAPEGSVTVDGDPAEWSDAGLCGAATAAKVKKGRELWIDPLDLSCEGRFRRDKDYLYLLAVVYDDFVERNAPANMAWGSDCVELFLGFDPAAKEHDAKANDTKGPSDFQIVLAPAGGGFKEATAWCCQLKGDARIKVASKTFKQGYVLEAAIPWKSFPAAKGSVLGMSFQACDSDAKGEAANTSIYWAGDWANCLRPKSWGTLKLQ